MASCLSELGKTYIEKLINGAIAELRVVFCFACIANEYEEEKVRLEAEIKTLEQRAKVAAGRDKDILDSVHYWKEKTDKLIQEDIKTKHTCFFGLCPNCIWRYKKGKELENNIGEMKRLTEKGEKLENIELPRRLPDVERYSSKDYISFQSRESKYKELLDALKDDNNYIIVLQGMGGTGKTTLAKEVGKELKLSGQFAHVILTTVSFTPDTKKTQDDIAGPLGLEWENCNDTNRPGKLWSRLTNGEKVLLIMDDVWDQGPPLDFDLLGIPKKDNHNGCKVLITTRSKRIFNIMGCEKMIELELISEEEAWTMFKLYAGITNSFPKSLITKGRKIAKECKRLPVAIAVIASSLKGQQHRSHEWDVTLKSLKKHVAMDNVDDDKVGVYKCLKSSYDYIKDEKAKGLFLLSSLFPEDKEIPIEILARLGIGTGLFGEAYDNYNDARNKVVVTKNKLIDSCLLLKFGEQHVKMHDLVREAAQWIAYKEIRSVNLSNKNEKSQFQRETNIKYLFCESKGMDLFSCKYDGSKLETLIVVIQRDEGSGCMEVPNSFFENVGKVRVLYFSGHQKRPLSLPDSIPSLENIRSILVDGIDLRNISVLGNLQSLETLDLVKCIIDELPNEIANLGKLKLLNLEECKIRRNDPFKVIGRCSTLEELYFIDSFNGFCREITLPQLQRYHIIKGQDRNDGSLSKYVSFEADNSKCFFSKETLKYCMNTTEGLRLSYISKLQYLIDTTGSQVSNVLSKLVVLELDDMEKLKELFKGSLPFDYLKNLEELSIIWCKKLRRLFSCKLNLCNLKNVKVRECPLLVNLSPLLTSRNLVLLENLEIVDCVRLTSIIIDERGQEESRDNKSHVSMFPKLKILVIEGCHLLESILPLLSSQDLPVLETLRIGRCDELKYIFGEYQHVEFDTPKEIHLWDLPKFMGMFQKYSHSMSSHVNESSSTSRDGFEVQTQVDAIKCNIFSWSCICCHGNSHRQNLGSMSTAKIPSPPVHLDPLQNNSSAPVSNSHLLPLWEHAQLLRAQSYFMCNLKEITLTGCLKIKYVFILSITPRMLVETLSISYCGELNQIIVDTRDDGSGGNDWRNVFPKLTTLIIQDCRKLEYIFGNYTDDYQTHIKIHLPTLQNLQLNNLPSLVAMYPKQYCLTFPSLKKLDIIECSLKYIGDFIIPSDSESPENTIVKELSGSIEHFTALERLVVHESKVENVLCFNEVEGEPMKLRLQMIELQDLHYMTCLFVGPKNSLALQNLTRIEIVRCEILEIIFTTSILRCLSQLVFIKIEGCKELKHIIKDDRQNQNLSQRTCFPKLEALFVIRCHKLKCVFPISIGKELPELKVLQISEADELEEIFQSEGDQKVQIPNINMVVLINLPSLCHAQGIQFKTARNRFVQNCQKLSLTSAYSPSHLIDVWSFIIDYDTTDICSEIFENMRNEKIDHYTSNKKLENPSAATTKNVGVGVGIEVEVEAALGQSTSQQDLINQPDLLEKINSTIKPSQGVKEGTASTNVQKITASTPLEIVSSSQISELEKEQPKSKKGLIIPQDIHGKYNTTIKPSQGVEEGIALTNAQPKIASIPLELAMSSQGVKEGTPSTNVQTITGSTPLELAGSSQMSELKKEQPKSKKGLINPQNIHGKYNTTIKPSQGVEEGIALTNAQPKIAPVPLELAMSSQGVKEGAPSTNVQTITTSTPLELASSSQMSGVEEGITLTNAQPKIALVPLELAMSSQELEKEQPTSQQGLIQLQDLYGEINTTTIPSQGVEEGTTLTNVQTITCSTPSELAKSSQVSELEKEELTSQQGLINPQDIHEKINTTIKASQGVEHGTTLTNVQTRTTSTRLQLASSSKELEKEQLTSQKGSTNPQDIYGEINTTIKLSQGVKEGTPSTNAQTITTTTPLELTSSSQMSGVEEGIALTNVQPKIASVPLELAMSSQELEKEQLTSQKGLIHTQDLYGEINTTIKPFQGVKARTALTNDQTITTIIHLELVGSSQEQDVGVRDSLENIKINDDQVSLNEDNPKGDEFIVLKSKPCHSNRVPLGLAFQGPSMHFEGSASQRLEDLSSLYLVTRELEELVSKKHVDYENLPLLADFFVNHPSVLLRDTSLSNRYKGYAYNCLAELLKFLQTHSVLDVLGSNHSEFVELLQDVRRFSFHKGWLDDLEKRALFSDLQFSQDTFQKLLDSKKQIAKDVEVARLKIDILTRDVEDIKHQLTSSEADLENIIQQERTILESKASLSLPLGY